MIKCDPILTKSRCGQPKLLYLGQKYNLHNPNSQGIKKVWRCVKWSCKRYKCRGELQFRTSMQGRPILIYRGHRFNKEFRSNTNPLSAKTRWRCVQRNHGCRAAVVLIHQELVRVVNGHNHNTILQ
ncbi:unnamed protein product [Chrysodeixis includens]|uniref:FLYWCH-type domain-containing protein n=1 Tax=Chrysodeixis includens TaxID=689277 RepID=A0A9N8L459_CHRIL|nr:unnamed protein product [Chrysodeixis includens]